MLLGLAGAAKGAYFQKISNMTWSRGEELVLLNTEQSTQNTIGSIVLTREDEPLSVDNNVALV